MENDGPRGEQFPEWLNHGLGVRGILGQVQQCS